MNKSLKFKCSYVLVFSMLVCGSAFALSGTNEIGIFMDPDGEVNSASYMAAPLTPFTAYLLVIDPVNMAYDDGLGTPPYERAMTGVSGFECQVMKDMPGLFILSEIFNGNMINIGGGNEYIVGFSEPVPVVNGVVKLITWSFMVTDPNPREIYLDIMPDFQSIPGAMAIVDGSISVNNLQACWPTSGSYEAPVFGINTEVVATEDEAWGSVKALFR
jgi:hypothetical protein